MDNRCTEIAADSTIWQEIEQGSKLGRFPINNILRKVVYANPNIMKGKVKTSFSLIIGKRLIEHRRKSLSSTGNSIESYSCKTKCIYCYFICIWHKSHKTIEIFHMFKTLNGVHCFFFQKWNYAAHQVWKKRVNETSVYKQINLP